MERIALFGGTFNPIHNGHVALAREVLKKETADKIIVMPCFLLPHKSVDFLVRDEDRLNICKAVFENDENITVSDIEIKRQGKSYTYDTVMQLKKIYKNVKIFVVCGGDMAVTLDKWYNYEALKKECGFILFKRKGISDALFEKSIEKLKKDGAEIVFSDSEIEEISSTEIRERIKLRQSIDDLVPKEVSEYIESHSLFEEYL